MKSELERQTEELEQTLQKQLELLKKESEDWAKVGGAVLAGALLVMAVVQLKKKKSSRKTDKVLEVLQREGLLDKDLEKKITKSEKATFWPGIGQRLLIAGLALAKEKYLKDLFNADQTETFEKGQ
ncbi:hypothetical protein [Algoriphagus formosus]|uniref:hypothetical protein n=1 Tax=Algoriphagus formosus TaxID=2007308 RepID=UPI000C289D6C|nr:hypothetical protein [Algoriphagus formosus]